MSSIQNTSECHTAERAKLDVLKSTSRKILTIHNFYPYRITLTQQLTLNDFQQKLEFCK